MKRSEVISMLKAAIKAGFIEYRNEYDFRESMPEHILKLLSDVKMEPPRIINPEYDREAYISYASHPFLEYDVDYYVNEWEKE